MFLAALISARSQDDCHQSLCFPTVGYVHSSHTILTVSGSAQSERVQSAGVITSGLVHSSSRRCSSDAPPLTFVRSRRMLDTLSRGRHRPLRRRATGRLTRINRSRRGAHCQRRHGPNAVRAAPAARNIHSGRIGRAHDCAPVDSRTVLGAASPCLYPLRPAPISPTTRFWNLPVDGRTSDWSADQPSCFNPLLLLSRHPTTPGRYPTPPWHLTTGDNSDNAADFTTTAFRTRRLVVTPHLHRSSPWTIWPAGPRHRHPCLATARSALTFTTDPHLAWYVKTTPLAPVALRLAA